VRQTIRFNRYSPRTEEAYIDWIERFIRFHCIRYPKEMGADEVRTFLTHLATVEPVPRFRSAPEKGFILTQRA